MELLQDRRSGETPQEQYLIARTNVLQVNLADRLGVPLDEFANYYAERSRYLIDKQIEQTNPNFVHKIDWEELENRIFIDLERKYFAGKVQQVLDFNK